MHTFVSVQGWKYIINICFLLRFFQDFIALQIQPPSSADMK